MEASFISDESTCPIHTPLSEIPLFFCHVLQADLQTSSQRLNLSASNNAVTELKPESCVDDVIHHEVKEIGTHMYVFFSDMESIWNDTLFPI